MSDLPESRLTLCYKPYKFCELYNFEPYLFREVRSERKTWGLLFTCLCTRCLHVKVVTGLDLNSFLHAFSCFTSLRRSVDIVKSDNASTFRAAADRLPNLLGYIQNSKIRFVNLVLIGSGYLVMLPAKEEAGR